MTRQKRVPESRIAEAVLEERKATIRWLTWQGAHIFARGLQEGYHVDPAVVERITIAERMAERDAAQKADRERDAEVASRWAATAGVPTVLEPAEPTEEQE